MSERQVIDMENEKKQNSTLNEEPITNQYDDDNIPDVDLPQDVIPDEVPRKDGPGGETGI